MFSTRFNKTIVITRHAQLRMIQGSIGVDELLDVIDNGNTRFKDVAHLWVYKHLPTRSDNLVCAVLVLEDALIVKTVMHHFDLEY
jgi:hypothetical protein